MAIGRFTAKYHFYDIWNPKANFWNEMVLCCNGIASMKRNGQTGPLLLAEIDLVRYHKYHILKGKIPQLVATCDYLIQSSLKVVNLPALQRMILGQVNM